MKPNFFLFAALGAATFGADSGGSDHGGGSAGTPEVIGGGSGDAPVMPAAIEGDDFELYGQGAQGAACGLGEGATCEACQ